MHDGVRGILRATGQRGNQILQVKSFKSVDMIRGHTRHERSPQRGPAQARADVARIEIAAKTSIPPRGQLSLDHWGLIRVNGNSCRAFYSVKHVWETCVDNVALELTTDLLHNPPRRLVGP
jgi:hypothetical protein